MSQPVGHSSAKFVLVALANCADDDGNCWPSVASIAEATEQDRKTVIANLKRLTESGWISDTKERKGITGQVVVYRLNRSGSVEDVTYGASVHYVYRITNPSTGQFYVGVRSTVGSIEKDRYMGSGKWAKACQFAGVKLTKDVLSVHESRAEAEQEEANQIVANLKNTLCMNSSKTGTIAAKMSGSGTVSTVPNFPINSTDFPVKDSQISLLRLPKTGHGTYQEPISEPINEQKEPRKRAAVDWVADLASKGVSRDVAESWLKVRKQKSAAVTVVAVDGMAREALKAGITLEEAMRIGCERGWAAFRADWLKDGVNARAGPKTPKPENFDLIDYGTGGRL